MKGKYCEYYWSVRKTKKGFVWHIRIDWRKGAEVLQSSLDEEDESDKYSKTARVARSEAYDRIRDYYSF